MRFFHRSGVAYSAVALAALFACPPLWARTMATVSYPLVNVWPAAIRFLRVDRGFPVREKDESAGYILFDFTDGPKPSKASLELIPATDSEGREATKVAVAIPDLPHRYEQMLLDKLAAKLREDHGPPAPPPMRKPESPKPDAAPPSPTNTPAPSP